MRTISTVAQQVLQETEKIIVGKRDKIRLIIMAVLADGHVLLDDLPGVGKTTLVKALALASGCEVKKMLYGHHGANQPVKDFARGTCAVTAQAIGYAVCGEKMPQGVAVSHVNWNDQTVEGLVYEGKDAFSVAFVPGGLGGPFDTTHLYDRFLELAAKNKETNA